VVGFARADVPVDDDFERYEDFIERGLHGEMGYLAAHREARRRLDTEAILPGAKTVVCLGQRYAPAGARPDTSVGGPGVSERIARYARGRDYHNHLKKRLRALAAFVRTLGQPIELEPGSDREVRARALCDVEPVLERVWAARSGIGFVGKNGLVISPGEGSYLLLGEVVTTLALPADPPMTERCGSCTRCLEACPTQAFEAPFVLDPRRCLAYLTIERREPIPEPLREAMGERLFGCDVCQEVCPYNRAASERPRASQRLAAERGLERGSDPYAPLDVWRASTLASLTAVDDEGHRELTRGSPLKRPGRIALAAHAVVVAVNAARSAAEGSDALREAKRALELGLAHDDERVREVARWGRSVLEALMEEEPSSGR
jgi:epoxyqueuosine reductase